MTAVCVTFRSTMKRDAVLNIRVPTEVKDALFTASEADGRSMSGMTVRILREWLGAQGYLDASAAPNRKQRQKASR